MKTLGTIVKLKSNCIEKFAPLLIISSFFFYVKVGDNVDNVATLLHHLSFDDYEALVNGRYDYASNALWVYS